MPGRSCGDFGGEKSQIQVLEADISTENRESRTWNRSIFAQSHDLAMKLFFRHSKSYLIIRISMVLQNLDFFRKIKFSQKSQPILRLGCSESPKYWDLTLQRSGIGVYKDLGYWRVQELIHTSVKSYYRELSPPPDHARSKTKSGWFTNAHFHMVSCFIFDQIRADSQILSPNSDSSPRWSWVMFKYTGLCTPRDTLIPGL